MSNAVAVIDFSAKRSSAVIRNGQRAWTAIKGTAAEQRFWWLDVGTALIEGKDKDNRKVGQKFSEWVQEMFVGLIQQEASDAIWFAENSMSLMEFAPTVSHPSWIRRLHNEQQATAALPADAPEINTVTAPKFKEKRDAVKFIKVDQRAESNDEGSETAKRHRAFIAKAHNTTVEALRKEAAQTAPDEAHRFNPSLQLSIDNMRANLRNSAASMEASGISKEAIRDIFVHFANSL